MFCLGPFHKGRSKAGYGMMVAGNSEFRTFWKILLGNSCQNGDLPAVFLGAGLPEIPLQNGYRCIKAHVMVRIVDAAVFSVPAHYVAFTS